MFLAKAADTMMPSAREGGLPAMSGPTAGRVFISYRREESSGLAGRLYDRLAARFGDDQVFMDVDTIALGVDFADVITQAVSNCEVLLAVIGPRWLAATDEDGQRRLDDPDDIVRLEIAAALERDIRVIPILVEGAAMPRRRQLPDELAKLARRNALILRHESFRFDADRLLDAVEPILRAKAVPAASNPIQAVAVPKRVEPERWRQELAPAAAAPPKTGYLAAGADDFLAVIPTAPLDQQGFLQRLADWAVALGDRRLAQLSTYHGKAGITTLLPRLSEGAGLVTIYKDARSSLQFWRSVFERRAPRSLAAVEAEVGEAGVRQGNVVYEISDELLAALTAAYEEAATGKVNT
jgi:hypothetical protein